MASYLLSVTVARATTEYPSLASQSIEHLLFLLLGHVLFLIPLQTPYAYTQAETVILFVVADGICTPRHACNITAKGFLRICWETCESSADACCAAGMSARAFTLFQSVGWFGYAGYPNSVRPWQNKQLWDWSHCCSMDVQRNRFFGLIAALFGYTVRPCR